jgi:NADPH:quinone reductase-like Zn-dependent oxidoreductase
MKAIVTTKQGPPDVLQLQEMERPQPKRNEVLVRVHAATVIQGDVILRKLNPLLFVLMRLFGVKKKRIPGHEFAGVVEEIGEVVTKFKPGDKVIGTTTGLSVGANAEFVCVPESGNKGVIVHMPSEATYQDAAPLSVGGMTALSILKKGNIQPGDKVLIYGASGSVGTYAVQLAKYMGAQVTGVTSTRNVGLVKKLGADKVIDYTQDDFENSGEFYDLVFDAVGKITEQESSRVLKENGQFQTVQKPVKEDLDNLIRIRELFEQGYIKPVIDTIYRLEDTANAHRYVETGRKKGNVVISITQNGLEGAN